jgi:hypothetical protein
MEELIKHCLENGWSVEFDKDDVSYIVRLRKLIDKKVRQESCSSRTMKLALIEAVYQLVEIKETPLMRRTLVDALAEDSVTGFDKLISQIPCITR